MARSISIDVGDWHALERYAERKGARTIADEVVRAFRDNNVLTYLYISALVFLGAAQVDALVRRYAGDAR